MTHDASTDPERGGPTDTKRLVDALNQLLEGEFIAIVHFVQHAGAVRGLNFRSVVELLRDEATQGMDHAIALTQTIRSLGGIPDWEIGRSHPFASTPDAFDVRRLLAHDLDHGQQLVAKYVEAIAIARDVGEHGIKVLLEGMLVDEQRAMHVIERMTETP